MSRSVVVVLEAAVSGDDAGLAAVALAALRRLAGSAQDPWVRGVYARCLAAEAASGAECESRFREALAAFTTAGGAVEVARTHLQYGEWLRRQRHRQRAAAHLRTALEMLTTAGHPLQERARRELGLAESRAGASSATLTDQELAVARLAARGSRNADIARQLFLSRHTVDYHLRKVFQKLGISSRRDVAAALDGEHPLAPSDR